MDAWDLANDRDCEEALEFFFGLPDNEEDSEVEADDYASTELAELEKSTVSNTVHLSEDERMANSTEVNSVTQQDEVISVDNECMQECQTLSVSEEEDGEWNKDTSYFDNLQTDFSKTPCTRFSSSSTDKEIFYFSKIFTDDIIQDIVQETNRYATENALRGRKGVKEYRHSNNWSETTVTEMKAFIGCLIIMGIHKLPSLSCYWKSDPYLSVSAIQEVMTSKRFKKLLENLHLNNNSLSLPRGDLNHDKLHKLRPLIDNLNSNIFKHYDHSSFLSVDESMIPFKGRSNMKQYMPQKPVKRGYKVWCLADALTGYVLNYEIYTGKTIVQQNLKHTLSERVVLQLSSCIKNMGCLLAFDNFFTTKRLMTTLLKDNILSVGTVRVNRKGLPSMMKSKDKLCRGEFMFEIQNQVCAIKWMDNRPVTALTTAFSPKETSVVKRKNKDGSVTYLYSPIAIAEYNKIMCGVDRFDQLLERYAIGLRSVKWWHRIFYYLLDLAIVNSYISKTHDKPRKEDQLTFRLNLARQLILGYSSRKRRGRPVFISSKKIAVPEEIRLSGVGTHFPETGTYRRCKLCSTKAIEKRTKFVCSACKVPLCITECFSKFHGKQ